MRYSTTSHSARLTEDYIFSQLIPYIGNKRKLLDLIGRAIAAAEVEPQQSTFLDAFSGSSVVARYAKRLGFAVTANDWEPYAEALSQASVQCNDAPLFFSKRSYDEVLHELNCLPLLAGWITAHLCPFDDENLDLEQDRMFYMRKNGMKLDAIRERIAQWQAAGQLNTLQRSALLAPLLYEACWLSNTSGVFKGFHKGWGGQTGTALYRIKADLGLRPTVFFDNGRRNDVTRMDATELALELQTRPAYDIAYLDPPYNQHPYGSNYHVLNTLTLWDKPALSPRISGRGDKSAIRKDWRTERRSAYNHAAKAPAEYRRLLTALNARYICTSYSTDGFIPLRAMIEANLERGKTSVFLQSYKRYRVSSQRFSRKPMNIEFVLLTDTSKRASRSVDSYVDELVAAEASAIEEHAETVAAAAC